MSDITHLSNFAADKTECPVYMTFGNQCSRIHKIPSKVNVVMVAVLPIPIKIRIIPQTQHDEQRQTNQEVLNEVLQWVLKSRTGTQNSGAKSGYYTVLSADGNFMRC
jgi:hypothetical protein